MTNGWQSYFLGKISAPDSPTNRQAATLWAASEGVLDKNNPFACSGRWPGATVCIAQCGSSSEVWGYDTIEHGCDANATFLMGSYYTGILAAFRADAGLKAIWQAINTSRWCSGCQNGKYPIELYNAIHSTKPPEEAPMYWTEFDTQLHAVAVVDGVAYHYWKQYTRNADGSYSSGAWNREPLPA